MACGNQSPELENDNRDAFYDIDACPTTPLSLLLKIRQPATAQSQPRPLPIGVMTDRSYNRIDRKSNWCDSNGRDHNERC